MDTIVNFAKQPSTWRGVAALAGAFGIYIDPSLLETAVAGVFAFNGLINTFRNEDK